MSMNETSAEDFNLERFENGWKVVGYRGNGGEIHIPAEIDGLPVVLIGANAFEDCRNITHVTVPDSVTFISKYAFWGCSSLASARLPKSIDKINLGTFMSCSSLTSVNVPKTVKAIGDGAFNSCTSLVSLEIPVGVESIGDSAFRGCSSLETVELPITVTSISRSAYRMCESLRTVTLHSTVTYIGPRAFQGCPSLGKVVIFGEDPETTVAAFRNHSLTYLVADYVIERNLMSFDDGKRLLTSKFEPETLFGARIVASCYPERLKDIPTKLVLTKSLAAAGRTDELRACEGIPGYLSKPAIMKCIDAANANDHTETVAYLMELMAKLDPPAPATAHRASGLEL